MMQKHKVRIPLSGNSFSGESLWAEKVGENLFRLANIPFEASGYAEGDIVLCRENGGWNEVISLHKDSGNGTLRLLFTNSQNKEALHVLTELTSIGCTFERASEKLVGVTVPKNLRVPFLQLSNFLNMIDDKVLIGWEIAKNATRQNSG